MLNRILDMMRGRRELIDHVGPYRLEVLCCGAPAPSYFHEGESYVLGCEGEGYVLRVINQTGRPVEAVVSVDGRDVIDGEPADLADKGGYLVPAWGHVDIAGWRVSHGRVAAFRFSCVGRSYAARRGSARDAGVIGVAIFPQREVSRRDRRCAEAGLGSGWRPATPAAAMPAASSGWDDGEHCAPRRSGLGTAFGEPVDAPAREVAFLRADPARPAAVLGVRYNDRRGLLAIGIDVDGWGELERRRDADPFPATRRFARPPWA